LGLKVVAIIDSKWDNKAMIVRVIGDITEDSYKQFSKDMSKAFKRLDDLKELEIELVSAGGVADVGLAFYGLIRAYAQRCTVCITVHGYCASAAIAILAAGDFRTATPEATFLIHNSRANIKNADHSEMQHAADKLESEEKAWAKLLEGRTSTPASVWRQLSTQSVTMKSDEALQFRLLTSILKDRK